MSIRVGQKAVRPAIPLRKGLGQHHLRHPGLCRPALEYLRPAGRLVVEIGAGGGILTELLLASGATVLTLELDPAWALALRRRPETRSAIVVVCDALHFAWARVPPRTLVAGNLPFSISTALITDLLPHRQSVSRAAFLVQREVATRLMAEPGSAAFGALSVLTHARAEVRLLGRVARGSFRPPPKVEAAFIGLELREPPLPEDEMGSFAATVRLAFARRRKLLRNALAADWGREEAERVIARVGLAPRCRAQELSLSEFVALHQAHRGRSGTSSNNPR